MGQINWGFVCVGVISLGWSLIAIGLAVYMLFLSLWG